LSATVCEPPLVFDPIGLSEPLDLEAGATVKPFVRDMDTLDDFFTQLEPESLVATSPDEAVADDWSGGEFGTAFEAQSVDGWGATAFAPTTEDTITPTTENTVTPKSPMFVPQGFGGDEWSEAQTSWESLDDAASTSTDAISTDAIAELALDVLATEPAIAADDLDFSHPALNVGDAVEVLCEEDSIWYQATLEEVGLGIVIADYGEGFDDEIVELKRIRIPPPADDILDQIQAAPEEEQKAYGDVDSHLLIERDSKGKPAHAAYTYVDEQTCVGCYNCAMVAPATFFMEDRYGSARVYHQNGDANEIIEEAIDTCPVDCIHAVSFNDLERLEVERRDQVINFAGRNMARAEGKNIMVASMTSSAGGSFSRVQDFEEIAIEDEKFRQEAKEKAKQRKKKAREEVERVSGLRQLAVEL
jgi:ferredoxin